MYNSAGKFFNFRRKLFFREALVGPSRRGPSAPSSNTGPASGPSAPPWPSQEGFCLGPGKGDGGVFFPGRACQRYNKRYPHKHRFVTLHGNHMELFWNGQIWEYIRATIRFLISSKSFFFGIKISIPLP